MLTVPVSTRRTRAAAAAALVAILAALLMSLPLTVFAQTPSNDATLSGLTVSPRDIIGFKADRRTYEVGVASTVIQATITATKSDPGATVAYSGTDLESNTPGLQVNLSAGRNEVTVTVTAEDTTTKTYTVRVNRGVTDDYGWKAVDDLDGLIAADSNRPAGIWSNGTTMWVADYADDKLYAYNTDGTRDITKDFDTLIEAGNNEPSGIWSDGMTMWVADWFDGKIYAYGMSDKARDSGKDFDTLAAAGNSRPWGIWSDGMTMWVADWNNDTIYAYRMSDTVRDSGKDFDPLSAAGNHEPTGIWSDGTTMWVADRGDDKIFAYRMSDQAHDSRKDFDPLSAARLTNPWGIWSDGTTMWVTDFDASDVAYDVGKVYSYNMPPPPSSDDATLSGLTVSPRNIIGFKEDRTTYEVGVASTVTQATITATANNSGATVAYSGTDLDSNTPGLQVNLSAGRNEVTVTVTSTDSTTTGTYTVSVNRGVTDFYGWKAALDLDGLIAEDNDSPDGIWSDGTTMWVADSADDKLYAYNTDGTRDSDKDFDTLSEAGNNAPGSIWSNGTTMWVADSDDQKLYAYRMSDKGRDSAKDFDTLATALNTDLGGFWSNGTTMWVADWSRDKLYAYNTDGTHDSAKDFVTLSLAGNNNPYGIWSDGTTMWVADWTDDKIYAYRMSDTGRDSAKDFDTLSAAGNTGALGISSDGTTMWVADSEDDKVYSYNMPESSMSVVVSVTASFESATYAVDEGDTVEAKVTLSADPERQVTIPITKLDQDGASSSDYSGVDASVTFESGDREQTITFTATDDTVDDDGGVGEAELRAAAHRRERGEPRRDGRIDHGRRRSICDCELRAGDIRCR